MPVIEEGRETPAFSEVMSKALSALPSAMAKAERRLGGRGSVPIGVSWASSLRAEARPRQAKGGEGSNAEISIKLGSRVNNKTGKLRGVTKVSEKETGKKDILLLKENRLSESYCQKPCLESDLDVQKYEAQLHAAQTVTLHEAQSLSMHEAQSLSMHEAQSVSLHEVSPKSLPH